MQISSGCCSSRQRAERQTLTVSQWGKGNFNRDWQSGMPRPYRLGFFQQDGPSEARPPAGPAWTSWRVWFLPLAGFVDEGLPQESATVGFALVGGGGEMCREYVECLMKQNRLQVDILIDDLHAQHQALNHYKHDSCLLQWKNLRWFIDAVMCDEQETILWVYFLKYPFKQPDAMPWVLCSYWIVEFIQNSQAFVRISGCC